MTRRELSNTEKAALMLMSLGKDRAAEVFRHLNEQEVKRITKAFTSVAQIDRETQLQIITEFQKLLTAGDKLLVDGRNFAQSVLAEAFGNSDDDSLVDYITGTRKEAINTIASHVPDHILINLIKGEHPQTAAFLLTKIDTQQAARVLGTLDEQEQSEVLVRIAHLKTVRTEVIDEVREVLKQALRSVDLAREEEVGGPKAAATILNLVDATVHERVFSNLDAQVPETAEQIRELMFTFEDLQNLDGRSIQHLLKEVPRDVLMLALKKTSSELSTLFFANMSARAAEMIREELASLGPTKLTDVEKAQQAIVGIARRMESEGKIRLIRGGTDEVLV